MESRMLKFKKFMSSEESKEPALLIKALIGGGSEQEVNKQLPQSSSQDDARNHESKDQETQDRTTTPTPLGNFRSPYSQTLDQRESSNSDRHLLDPGKSADQGKKFSLQERDRNKLFTFASGYERLREQRETTQENQKEDFVQDLALDQAKSEDTTPPQKTTLLETNYLQAKRRVSKRRKSRVAPSLGISDRGFADAEQFETDVIATSPYADDYYVRFRQIQHFKRCIILPDDPWKEIWDIFITLQASCQMLSVLVFTVIVTPYRIAFYEQDGLLWTFIEYAVDLSFLLDMIFNFRSAYFNSQDQLVSSLPAIACNYLKGWFCIDLVAIFPLNQILRLASRSGSSLNQMARLARLPRLYKVMQFSRVCKICKRPNRKRKFLNSLNDMLKVSAACERMLVFLMILMIMCHMVSCMWYFVATVEQSPDSWIHSFPELSTDAQFYFVGIYFTITTITTVGYGDISASTNGERFLCSVLMLIGVVSYSYAIGSLSSILTTLDAKTAKLKQKLGILENIRKEFKLNFILYRKMKTAIHFDHTKDLTDKYALINALPHRLQVELSIVVHQQLIQDIHFFKNKPGQFIAMVAPRLKSMGLAKHDYIFHQNDPIDALYFLRKGTVGLVVRKFPSDLVFIKVQQGSYFGEYDFLISGKNQGKRCFTAKALTDVELLLLDKLDLYRVDQEFKVVTEQLFSRAFARLKQAELAQERAEKWLRRKISVQKLSPPKEPILSLARIRNSQETVTEEISAEFGESASGIMRSQEKKADRFQKLADFLRKHCPQLQASEAAQHELLRAIPKRKGIRGNYESPDESSFSSALAGSGAQSPIHLDTFYTPSDQGQKKSHSKSRDRYSQLVSKDSYLQKNQIIQDRSYQLNPHTGKLENSMLTLLTKIGERLATIEKRIAKKTKHHSEQGDSFKGIKRTDSEPVKERRISFEEQRAPSSSVLLPLGTYKKTKEESLAKRLKIKSELRQKMSEDEFAAQEKGELGWKW